MRGKIVPDTFSPVDVLDRVLDKCVVIEKGWVLLPLDLVRLEARVVISSLNTYLTEAGGPIDASAKPPLLIEAGPIKTKRPGRSNFKLIAQYDARRNEYSIWNHNLTEAQALEAVAEHCARVFSIFIVDQKQKHEAKEVDVCKACRRDVERAAQLQPQPKFKKKNPERNSRNVKGMVGGARLALSRREVYKR